MLYNPGEGMEKYQLEWSWRLSCIWLTQAKALVLKCISEKPNKTHSFSRASPLEGVGLSPRDRALQGTAVIFLVALKACFQSLLFPFRCPVPSCHIYGSPPLTGRPPLTATTGFPPQHLPLFCPAASDPASGSTRSVLSLITVKWILAIVSAS